MLLQIHVTQCSPALHDDEDSEVEGMYEVDVPDDEPYPCGSALDSFHNSIAIGCLDDFDIIVFDPESIDIMSEEEAGESEDISEEYNGDLDVYRTNNPPMTVKEIESMLESLELKSHIHNGSPIKTKSPDDLGL